MFNSGAATHASCTLATTGLSEVDSAVLVSMLGLLKDRTSKHWKIGSPQQADFLMVGSEPDAQVLAGWKASGKAWICGMRAQDARPPTDHTLPLPFRMFPLLMLLQELENLPTSHSAPGQMQTKVLPSQWRFAQALHDAKLATAHGHWRRANNIYMRDDACAFAADQASLDALHCGALSTTGFEETLSKLPNGLLMRPVQELTWFVGWWADGDQLAPWLSPQAHHQLRQWPDFGSLHASQPQLRLAALLVSSAWTVDGLVNQRGYAREQVIRFMNAASLSGLLIESAPALAPPAPKPSGFLAKLLDNVRTRLGMRENQAPPLAPRGNYHAA